MASKREAPARLQDWLAEHDFSTQWGEMSTLLTFLLGGSVPEVTDQSRNALAVLSGTLQSVDDDTWAAARKRADFTDLGPKLAVLMCH